MSEFLRGNFEVKKMVTENEAAKKSASEEIAEHLKKKALANICGSMVYVEKTELTWNGDPKDPS